MLRQAILDSTAALLEEYDAENFSVPQQRIVDECLQICKERGIAPTNSSLNDAIDRLQEEGLIRVRMIDGVYTVQLVRADNLLEESNIEFENDLPRFQGIRKLRNVASNLYKYADSLSASSQDPKLETICRISKAFFDKEEKQKQFVSGVRHYLSVRDKFTEKQFEDKLRASANNVPVLLLKLLVYWTVFPSLVEKTKPLLQRAHRKLLRQQLVPYLPDCHPNRRRIDPEMNEDPKSREILLCLRSDQDDRLIHPPAVVPTNTVYQDGDGEDRSDAEDDVPRRSRRRLNSEQPQRTDGHEDQGDGGSDACGEQVAHAEVHAGGPCY